MANLDVQPKKRSPLPWILLLIIVAALAIWFFTRDNATADSPVGPADTAAPLQQAP